MRFLKQLILLVFLYPAFGAGEVSFRGYSADELIPTAVPLAFKPFLQASGFNTDAIHFQRGEYLIVVPDGLLSYINDLVAFKKSQGFDVTVIPLSVAGSTADDIKAYIGERLASNPLLEYVLLIGDVDGTSALPSFYYSAENDVSDQKYTHLVGDDFIPDVFIGRLSVDTPVELIVAILKTIKYHRDALDFGDWLDRGLVVAGNYSNTVPIPITPVWTSRWVREVLLDEGYSTVDSLYYPPIQYGAPQIQSYINNGVGLVNYRGWGDANGWHYPEFHVSDISGLSNGWMTPVFTSFVCNANDFANNVDPCLGEALLRAGTPSVPKGGVAVIGPSDLHTSTKYNNIINVYMYDALLDNGVYELAPAMLAGQMGLIREFPDQNGAGEAQEFYFHVYNITGDPSLNIHIKSPDVFTMDVSSSDMDGGYIQLNLSDSQNRAIRDAVISIMIGDSIIAKGMSDPSGLFTANVPSESGTEINIYANKPGFVQGLVTLNPTATNIVFDGYNTTGSGLGTFSRIQIGAETEIYPLLRNNSGSVMNAGTASVSSGEGISLTSNTFSYDAIAIGESQFATTPINLIIEDYLIGRDAVLDITLDNSDTGKLGLNVEPLPISVVLGNDVIVSPNGSFVPTIYCENMSDIDISSLHINLTSLTDLVDINNSGGNSNISIPAWGNVTATLDNYNVEVGDLSWGSTVTLTVELTQGGYTVYQQNHEIPVLPQDQTIPAMPSRYGYWAYDDTDTGYDESPIFNWIELDPDFGGSGGTLYELDDDDHVSVDLPFTFTYYGEQYNGITISSNGWISLVPCSIDYFWNYTIPMAMGPKAQIAAFWDDLEVVGTDWIRVLTQYDQSDNRFIIEWSRALNNFDEVTAETFEIILYDPSSHVTPTGDGIIEFQYLDILDVDVEKNYATVGIEDHFQNDGIQYTFNNTYLAGAAPLTNGRAIRFTTNPPPNFQAPLAVTESDLPTDFTIYPVYPNPFNPVTNIQYYLEIDRHVSITVYDILGKVVTRLINERQHPGFYSVQWNGKSKNNTQVASGTYFVELKTDYQQEIQKLLLIK